MDMDRVLGALGSDLQKHEIGGFYLFDTFRVFHLIIHGEEVGHGSEWKMNSTRSDVPLHMVR
jgi:hypothetical protein